MSKNKKRVNIEDLRFFALKHRKSRKWIYTNKNKCYWRSIADLKTAFHYHSGQRFDSVRHEFEIVEFELKRIEKKNKYFADLWQKKAGKF